MIKCCNASNGSDLQTQKNSFNSAATNLKWIPKESVDYIYSDPPYGKKIPYLDLSVNVECVVGFEVTKEDYEMEAIEGGEMVRQRLNTIG